MEFLNESLVVAICFIIFLYLAYRPVRNAIFAALDARVEEIKRKLSETENLKKEAKLLLDEIQQEMEAFEERKKRILDSAHTSTQRLVDTKIKEAELMLSRKKNSAIKSIETQKDRASDQMRAEFTDAVLGTVRAYLDETKNNNTSDEEIITHFLKNR